MNDTIRKLRLTGPALLLLARLAPACAVPEPEPTEAATVKVDDHGTGTRSWCPSGDPRCWEVDVPIPDEPLPPMPYPDPWGWEPSGGGGGGGGGPGPEEPPPPGGGGGEEGEEEPEPQTNCTAAGNDCGTGAACCGSNVCAFGGEREGAFCQSFDPSSWRDMCTQARPNSAVYHGGRVCHRTNPDMAAARCLEVQGTKCVIGYNGDCGEGPYTMRIRDLVQIGPDGCR